MNQTSNWNDYFALCEYIREISNEIEGQPRFFVFIGELGAYDGTTGMYIFVTNHPKLKELHRSVIYDDDDLQGGRVTRELFIYQLV